MKRYEFSPITKIMVSNKMYDIWHDHYHFCGLVFFGTLSVYSILNMFHVDLNTTLGAYLNIVKFFGSIMFLVSGVIYHYYERKSKKLIKKYNVI